jgi:hypothetical protein
MPGYWRSRIPFVSGLEKLNNFAVVSSPFAWDQDRIGLPCLQNDIYVASLNLLVRHTEVSRLGRCDQSAQWRIWYLRSVRPWLRTQFLACRQKPSLCHQLDYATDWLDMRSVMFTAAAKDTPPCWQAMQPPAGKKPRNSHRSGSPQSYCNLCR